MGIRKKAVLREKAKRVGRLDGIERQKVKIQRTPHAPGDATYRKPLTKRSYERK